MNSTIKITVGGATWELLRDGHRVGASGPYAVKIATECQAAVRRSLQEAAAVDGKPVQFMSVGPVGLSPDSQSAWFTLRWRECTADAWRDFEQAVQRQIEKLLLGPTHAVGSLAWVRHVVGSGAHITQDPTTASVIVTLPAGTSQERAREVDARLHDEGYAHIEYTVRVAPGTWDRITLDGVPMPPVPRGYATVAEVEERRAREAPLVALVANVPEGLDANGWRAAVLAVHEHFPHSSLVGPPGTWAKNSDFGAWLRLALAGSLPMRAASPYAQGLDAYRRGVQPPPARPAPHRRRAPGLPLDSGEG